MIVGVSEILVPVQIDFGILKTRFFNPFILINVTMCPILPKDQDFIIMHYGTLKAISILFKFRLCKKSIIALRTDRLESWTLLVL